MLQLLLRPAIFPQINILPFHTADLFRRIVFHVRHDPPLIQMNDPVCKSLHHILFMGHQNHQCFFGKNPQKLHDPDGILLIQISGGFIRKNNPRACYKGSCHSDPLHLPSRKIFQTAVFVLLHPHSLQSQPDPLLFFLRRKLIRSQCHPDIFQNRHFFPHIFISKDKCDIPVPVFFHRIFPGHDHMFSFIYHPAIVKTVQTADAP